MLYPVELVLFPPGDHGGARPELRWLVDVTIAYPEADRPLDLVAVMAGNRPPCNVLMYYRVYDVKEVMSVVFHHEDAAVVSCKTRPVSRAYSSHGTVH